MMEKRKVSSKVPILSFEKKIATGTVKVNIQHSTVRMNTNVMSLFGFL